MSNTKCCVPGCENSAGSQDTLHKFPNPEKEKELFNTWVYAVGGDILELENDHIFKYRRVCHRHFAQKYWCRSNRISNIAVPTEFMPGHTSLSKFTLNERRPLRLTQSLTNSKEPLASCSSTPIQQLHSEIALSAEDIHNMKENIAPVLTQKSTPIPLCVTNPSTSKGNRNIVKSTPKQPLASCDSTVAQLLHSEIALNLDNILTKENLAPVLPEISTPMQQRVTTVTKPSTSKGFQNIVKSTPKQSHNTDGVKIVAHKLTKHTTIPAAEHLLHKKLLQVRVKLSKCRNSNKKQAVKIRALKKITTNPEFLKTLDNLSSPARILTLMQFRESKKETKGRRFTVQEKILSLSIMKQSPKGYRFLRKIFVLPAPQTLLKLLHKANIKPGINENIIKQIKKATENMTTEEKLCVVLFDEMSLKANVSYNERKDRVIGFVDNGEDTNPEFADHAQVFMVRGLIKNYKQPVAYTFTQAATKGPELARQLKAVIRELQAAGLIVVATVCDQGTNNVQCIKLLMQETHTSLLKQGQEMKGNIFKVNGQKIIPLYDPPHLIKGIRNNLLTKDLKYFKDQQNKTAKWEHIQKLHNENPGYKGIRLVPKLTDYHVVPHKISKMKVKYATQLFSQTVATNMGYLADKGILPSECKDTADILLFFDKLFDSVNGSFEKSKKHGKPLLGPVTPNSAHHKIWREYKKELKNMKFINRSSGKVEHVPTINNWVWTIDGIEGLLKNLKEQYNVTSVWLRHLNQDPIENFFGSIRSHGCRNINPTPEKFESAFATLLINNLSSAHAPGANCEQDNCYILQELMVTSECKATPTWEIDSLPNIIVTPFEDKKDPREIGGLQYVSGYIVKNAKQNVFKGCTQCKTDLMTDTESEYIKCREYVSGKKWLCSPSDPLLHCISYLQDIIIVLLKTNFEKKCIKEVMKTMIFLTVEFNFVNCEIHKNDVIDYLINISCRFFIYNYCKEINKILCNKRECDDDEDKFKIKAKKYFQKCLKRKNK